MLLALWIIGQQVVLYLAGLQDVPQDLYDAADVDGAGFFRRLRHITVPLMTPIIFFQLITLIIASLQFFAIPYIMTGGTGFPANSTLFYSIYLYKQAFQYFNMGYASAMAWLLFVTTLIVTLVSSARRGLGSSTGRRAVVEAICNGRKCHLIPR